jgi:hypothetical protein
MDHIASGHMRGGSRVSQLKNLFPEHMGLKQVERAVREAYRLARRLAARENGPSTGPECRAAIEMWVNRATNTIGTAYPW